MSESRQSSLRINILTIFPEMFAGVFSSSILGRAQEQGLLEIRLTDIRPYSASKHHNTDDYPFGGGAGMVMMAQPIISAMREASALYPDARRIYLGPRGKKLSTPLARELAREKELILLCGHYEGVDQRALDTCIDEEISVGDYILTGGETAAIVLVDCLSRFVPGVLGSAAVYPSAGSGRHNRSGCSAERGPREDPGMASAPEFGCHRPSPAGFAENGNPQYTELINHHNARIGNIAKPISNLIHKLTKEGIHVPAQVANQLEHLKK